MKTKQYTIRNIPEPVDRYLRKRSRMSGKSLNQVVIEELSENVGVGKQSLVESLDWFIGSGGIDNDVLTALKEEDEAQKRLMKQQWLEDYDSN